MKMYALFKEFCAWRKSAKQYAAALELYGRACAEAAVAPWPPSELARDVMVVLCQRPGTLAYYLRGIRSVLRLVRADVGALAETSTLVVGVRKVADGHGAGELGARVAAR